LADGTHLLHVNLLLRDEGSSHTPCLTVGTTAHFATAYSTAAHHRSVVAYCNLSRRISFHRSYRLVV
jgi:hypothetical protein